MAEADYGTAAAADQQYGAAVAMTVKDKLRSIQQERERNLERVEEWKRNQRQPAIDK